MVSGGQFRRINAAAHEALAGHIGADGRIACTAPARLVTVRP